MGMCNMCNMFVFVRGCNICVSMIVSVCERDRVSFCGFEIICMWLCEGERDVRVCNMYV